MKDESLTLENCAFVRKKKMGSRDTCRAHQSDLEVAVTSGAATMSHHAVQIMFVTPSMGEPEFLCPGADTWICMWAGTGGGTIDCWYCCW